MTDSSNRKKKVGLPPGSIVYTGENPKHKISIEVFSYNDSVIKKENYGEDEEIDFDTSFRGVTWVSVDGIHNIPLLKKIGEYFDLDNLVLEDLANSTQRAKVEEREEYLFIVMKLLKLNLISKEIGYEQVSFILGEDCLLTFQESPGDFFDGIRTRIEAHNSKMRKKSVGYLAYTIIDTIVDNYFIVLDEVEMEIDRLEAKVINDSDKEDLQNIMTLKQKVTTLKRTIGPIRELIAKLQSKGMTEYFNEDIKIYLTDLFDHGTIVCDTLDILNSRVTELIQLYHSTISNGMNEVMKILAIISTIFMPLSFLASLYGMNFKYMPELEWKEGYYAVLALMFVLVLGMLTYFKRKKWL